MFSYRVFLFALLFTGAIQARAQQIPGKIAVINIQSAITGTKDGQKASQELTTKFDPKQKELNLRKNEVLQLEDQLQKGGNLMSADKQSQLTRDVDSKKKKLQRDTQDAEEELETERGRLLQSLGQRMLALIEKYAKDNGYAVVFDISNPNTPVLYAATSNDITQEIISLYDKTPAIDSTTSGGMKGTPPK